MKIIAIEVECEMSGQVQRTKGVLFKTNKFIDLTTAIKGLLMRFRLLTL